MILILMVLGHGILNSVCPGRLQFFSIGGWKCFDHGAFPPPPPLSQEVPPYRSVLEPLYSQQVWDRGVMSNGSSSVLFQDIYQ